MDSWRSPCKRCRWRSCPGGLIGVAAQSWRGVMLYSQGGDIWHEPCPASSAGRIDWSEREMPVMCWSAIASVLAGRGLSWSLRCCAPLRGGRSCRLPRIIANDYADGVRGTDEGRAVDSARSVAKTPSVESTSTVRKSLPASQPQHGPARLVASGVSPKRVLAAVRINALIACRYWSGCRYINRSAGGSSRLVGIACLVGGLGIYRRSANTSTAITIWVRYCVFIFFGLVAACGTMFALAGTISTEGMLGGANVGLHRRRGPVRQQPTRRRRPTARTASTHG